MPIEVTMPRLSDTMEQGTVVKWNVKEGDKVKSGDVIADIETDKATMELQTFDDGVVAKLAVPEGQTVKVGAVILLLAGAGEKVDAAPASSSTSAKAPAAKQEGGHPKPAAPGSSSTAVIDRPRPSAPANGATVVEPRGRVFASPLAKKIAEEAGVTLDRVEGTGPSGRITRKDVEDLIARGGPADALPTIKHGSESRATQLAAAQVPPTPAVMVPPPGAMLAGKVVTLSNMRRTIAKRLAESKSTIPHYQVTVEAEMDALLALRKQLNDQLESQGVKLSVNDFLVRACALAMHQHPYVNSRWLEKGGESVAAIEIVADVNIGVAIALPEERGGGLVVATLRNADRMGLRQVSSQTKTLAEKARVRGLTVEEMADSTFTISNLGMFGVSHFNAIINPPNVAILAVGAAIQKPVVRNGQLAVGSTMSMTMSSDHRVVDGAMAAQYLATVKQMLEKPATLLV